MVAAGMLATCVTMVACSNDHGEVPVASVHTFAADGVTCRDCGDAVLLEEMRQAIAAREGLQIVDWYGEHLDRVRHPGEVVVYVAGDGRPLEPGDYTLAAQVARLPEQVGWELIRNELHRDEYVFRVDGGTLTYERKVLWYWPHASQSYLTRHDMKGRRLWRRPVPILEAPVWPVVTRRFTLYETIDVEGTLLAFVELDSGRAGRLRLPSEKERFGSLLPSSVLPYVWDRFVVLQTCNRVFDGPGAGRGVRFVPADIIVVELTEDA
jgi:nucleoid-associated protein YgaU